MILFQPFRGWAPPSLCGRDPRRSWEGLMSSLGEGCRGLSAASLGPSLGPPSDQASLTGTRKVVPPQSTCMCLHTHPHTRKRLPVCRN